MKSLCSLLFALCFLLLPAMASGQLQQSGGSGSTTTITQGGNSAVVTAAGALSSNIAQVNGNTALAGNGATGTGSLRVTIASDNTAFTVNSAQSGTWTVQPGNTANTTAWLVTGTGGTFPATQSGTWTMQPGNTANTTAWLVKSVPSTTCGTTAVSQALAAVPTSSTAVFSSTTCLVAAYFNNTNGSAQTVTLTDNAGTPVNGVGPAFSVPALSNLVIPLYGIPFTTGVKWTAGGTGITGGMIGYQ
jgi:hypothetical protein